jgi:hypothetical protein
MAFLWLEFSQSFQVLPILASTLAHVVAFGFRFWVGAGLPAARVAWAAPVALACQLALLGCNLACRVGVVRMHLGVSNGIDAWLFNTLLNAALIWVFDAWFFRCSFLCPSGSSDSGCICVASRNVNVAEATSCRQPCGY